MNTKRRMFEKLRVFGDLTGEARGIYITSLDPYSTIGQQIRSELDREHEAVAFLEARGYKVIKVGDGS